AIRDPRHRGVQFRRDLLLQRDEQSPVTGDGIGRRRTGADAGYRPGAARGTVYRPEEHDRTQRGPGDSVRPVSATPRNVYSRAGSNWRLARAPRSNQRLRSATLGTAALAEKCGGSHHAALGGIGADRPKQGLTAD